MTRWRPRDKVKHMDRAMSRKVLKQAGRTSAIERRAKGVEKMVWVLSQTHVVLRDAYDGLPEPTQSFPEFVDAVVQRGLRRKNTKKGRSRCV